MIVAALDEAVGSFREEDGAEDEDGNGDCAHGERESPAPARFDLLGAEVEEVCEEFSNADAEGEAIVDCSSVMGRCHF